MSSIDRPEAIRKLIERSGGDLPEGYNHKGKHVVASPRHTTEQIWAYITGFGSPCFKLIYGMYPNGMNDTEAAAIFLATANIRPDTTPTCLFHSGKLTEAGKLWWIGLWGQDSLPK